MTEYFQMLQGHDPTMLLVVLFGLVLITGTGLFPSHNDLLLGLIVLNQESLNVSLVSVVLVYFCALSIAEISLYFIGDKLGGKVLESKFVKSKFNKEKQMTLKRKVNENSLLMLIGLRMAPMFRPQLLLVLSSFGVNAKPLIKYYFPMLLAYICTVVSFFYLGNKYLMSSLEDFKFIGFILMSVIWLGLMSVVYKRLSK